MESDKRRIVLDIARPGKDDKSVPAEVVFCEYSASLTIQKLTIHIPWTELAVWQMWAANRLEQSE